MKNQKKRSFFLLLLCMALICIPVQADASRTTFTAEVPEQPADALEAPKGAKTLGEIPLPAGWVWEQPDTELVPDSELTAAALYRDEEGKVLARRTVAIHISKAPETTDPTKPTEPIEPTETIEPTNPTKPTEPTEPTEPIEPADSTKPTDPQEPTVGGSAAKTGDETPVMPLIAVLLLSGGFLCVGVLRKHTAGKK